MSEWTPKVGDKVMVGEHGPYRVVFTEGGAWADLRSIPENNVVADGVPLAWLTPAPEPEPAAPGALVRDGEGDLVALGDDLTDERAWVVLTGDLCGEVVRWRDLPRPVTVVLADPAEVEQLRDSAVTDAEGITEDLRRARRDRDDRQVERDMASRSYQREMKRADELQRRHDDTLRYLDTRESLVVAKHAASLLRGES